MKNNNKIMLSLAMVASIAVAAIGIGYAYQASTSNNDNVAQVQYYKIGPKDGSSAVISTKESDYAPKFTAAVQFNTVTTVAGTTFEAVSGTDITVLSKSVANVGNLTLIAFDQNGAITSPPTGKTHETLHISIATGTTNDSHTVNTNYTIIAKIGAFTSSDKENAYTAAEGDKDIVDGFTKLTLADGAYQGDLYVPYGNLSTGFEIYLGAYVTTQPSPGDLKDADMIGGGSYDSYVLYDADVTLTMKDTGWIKPSEAA